MKWNTPLHNAVIEITNACNLKCNHCGSDSGNARPDELTTIEMRNLIDELKKLGCSEVTLLGGEIFLRKDWHTIARAITDNDMRLILITNGLLIDEHNYRLLQETGVYLVGISIDGPDKEKYKALRGIDGFDKVMTLLKKMEKDPHFPNVNAISTFTRGNLPWFKDFVPLFKNTGITWQIQIANKGGSRFDESSFFTREDFKDFTNEATRTLTNNKGLKLRFMDDFGYFPLKPELSFLHQTWKGCIAGRELVGIRSDGKVCGCLSLGEKYMEADVKTESLTHIWTSGEYFRAFRTRENHLTGTCFECDHKSICRGGCAAMALSATGSLSQNTYCIRQLEEEEIREDLWG